ncbi:hypothetical protein V2A60_002600 [Cordyceps javanica]|uniref:Alpha-ribazole-5'-phosphate phosphatase n=1 Tax=Cordyceps javanica TaxID=43265 RepID=A0A545UY49_9HYPO|nr:alpha-ribazole-5'-phosphate phosphatase [Cordyceps javanica]TQW06237.1 alpha-ribazole-5'-phosphate phosphatase [Cordyceps javanica]
MRLLLVRHGETVDNVAGNYAGVTDSPLTAHGALQAGRLAAWLAARFSSRPLRAIFTSDLQRAARTGGAVRSVCGGDGAVPVPLRTTPLLRERDFGPLEGVPCRDCRVDPETVAETTASMRARARRFLDEMLLPLLYRPGSRADDVCVVVAHGLLLRVLYACLLECVPFGRLTLERSLMPGAAGAGAGAASPMYPGWANTGYLECMLLPGSPNDHQDLRMHVLQVNCTTHLKDMRRTRGGIGSAAYDSRQRSIDSYFAAPAR